MTRFARAKGSKASNERVPEEATPWHQMKHGLMEKNNEIAESKKKQAAIEQRNANYKAFLAEREEAETKNSVWAEFPSSKTKKGGTTSKRTVVGTKDLHENSDDDEFLALKAKVDVVLKKPEYNQRSTEDNDDPREDHSPKILNTSNSKINKTKKKKLSITKSDSKVETGIKRRKQSKIVNENIPDAKIKHKSDNVVEIKKKKTKPKEEKQNNKSTDDSTQVEKQKKRKSIDGENSQPKIKKLKKSEQTSNTTETPNNAGKQKQKGNIPKKVHKEPLTETDLKKLEKKKQKKIKQVERRKKARAELKKQQEEEEQKKEHTDSNTLSESKEETSRINKQGKFEKPNNFQQDNKFKNKKFEKTKNTRDSKEHNRRKPFLPTKMFINGKEVDVDYVDGFPVKKEDAVRLKKLRKEMISKGLPRSEINIALKLERRKAEKAFAREKKKVCFNCRKSGHNLSECPDIGKDQVAVQSGCGICFKCGSTEHTHFECKVVRGQEFKYAQCFICNEQGHIARQCPDNARGLYPKGGACRVCGDVTHLKKDCPKYQAEQQQIQNSLAAETIGDSNPDVLDNKSTFRTSSFGTKTPNKIIKF